MVVRDNRKPNWIFYPGWVVLSAISFLIAGVITWTLMSQIVKVVGDMIQVGGQTHITEDFLFFYILLPILGLLTGLLQYLLLRRYLPRMGRWIAATVLGWLLAFVGLGLFSATFSSIWNANPMWSAALAGGYIGGLIGLPQWVMLRQRVRRAAWWLLGSILGWGVASLIVDGPISSTPDVLAVVFLPPIATSIAWWLLLDKLPQRESNERNTPPDLLGPTTPISAN